MTERDKRAVVALVRVIILACKDAGVEGVAESLVWSAMSEHGVSFVEFQVLVDVAILNGFVRREFHRLYAVEP